ncbi:hypothetical protein BDW74DRAFT_169111 [Aspergillus multicolor]|uniref:uncharacterized protein n=1 Tax=Aspergillus multicolor TaxID=41759 RepID=UPI003CCE246B
MQKMKEPFQLPLARTTLPRTPLIDEERFPGYDSQGFYPVGAGDVLANRYQVLLKIGWGVSSTPELVVALKIGNATSRHTGDREGDVEEHIAKTDPSHDGRSMFRTSMDYFRLPGPLGSHVCRVYMPMRELFWHYQRGFKDRKVPLPVVKTYIRFLLTGLDYLHTDCKVVHTDLKLENIMVDFEDFAILGDFLNSTVNEPVPCKVDSNSRLVYHSCTDFGPLTKVMNIPQFVDFGSALDHYRAPEVILGCGWSMSADTWNMGVLVWDFIQGRELFQHIYNKDGTYNLRAHIAEIIGLLGPPPPETIAKYNSMAGTKWQEAGTRGSDSKRCESATDFFDGPFFDANGRFFYEELIPKRSLEEAVPSCLMNQDREGFLSFVRGMLTWVPDERKRAGELIEHPFLQLGKVQK